MLKQKLTLKNFAILAVVAIGPFLPRIFGGNNYIIQVFTTILLYVIMSTALNLLLGYSGQISMGNAAFYGIGAYATGLLVSRCNASFWICFPASIVICFLSGLIIGFPSKKLGAIFLAFVTIAFNNIINLVMINWDAVTGGAMGMRLDALSLFGHELSRIEFYWLTYGIMLLILLIFYSLIRSRTGRALVAIKGNPIAASAMGINVNSFKLLTFGIAAAMTGAAGCLYAYMVQYISPNMFTTDLSTKVLTMVIIGGLGSLNGGLVGAVLLGLATELLREFGDYQMVAYGLAIVVLLQFAPRGIMGGVEKLKERYLAARAKRQAVRR